MTLDQLARSQAFRVVGFKADEVMTRLMPFGLFAGSRASLVRRIVGGPVVVSLGAQEIAISRELASRVEVDVVEGA